MKLGASCHSVSFFDVTGGYIYVLIGFLAHLYIIFSGSLYFALQEELCVYLNVTKETLINYFAFFSIILLLISLSLKLTWPIRIEQALLVLFIWILLRNLIPKECLCCVSPSTAIVALPQHCPWHDFNTFYSILCVIVMVSSFLMNARHRLFSLCFTVLAIVLMIFTSLLPVSCNQLSAANANAHLLKFTLYSIVWFVNRRMRLTEHVLSMQYLKSIRMLYSYQDCHQNHLLCGAKHGKKRRYVTQSNPCDEVACFIEGDEDCLVPCLLFHNLEELSKVVLKQKTRCMSQEKMRHVAWQSHQMLKIHQINCSYNAKRWFGNFFSWKHRCYDADMLNLFDLTKTLWILNVCPIFLVFVFLEYLLLLYHIAWNIQELQCLIERVKVMCHIRCCEKHDTWFQ